MVVNQPTQQAEVLDLRTGREIANSAVARTGFFKNSGTYDHAADAAFMVIREHNQIEGEGHALEWIDKHRAEYDALVRILQSYAADELLRAGAAHG